MNESKIYYKVLLCFNGILESAFEFINKVVYGNINKKIVAFDWTFAPKNESNCEETKYISNYLFVFDSIENASKFVNRDGFYRDFYRVIYSCHVKGIARSKILKENSNVFPKGTVLAKGVKLIERVK